MGRYRRLLLRGVLGFALAATLNQLGAPLPVYLVAAAIGILVIWRYTGDLGIMADEYRLEKERLRRERGLD